MKFEKDMKEWNMFGELYALLKKCTMGTYESKEIMGFMRGIRSKIQ